MKKYFIAIGRMAILFIILMVLLLAPWSYSISFPGLCLPLKNLVITPDAKLSKPGELFLTTVFYERANLLFFITAQFYPNFELLPLDPPTKDEFGYYDDFMRVEMDQSQLFAKLAALKYLGYKISVKPVGVKILQILPKSLAKGKLRSDDVILAAESHPIATLKDLNRVVNSVPPGKNVKLSIYRSNNFKVSVPTINYQGRRIIGFHGETLYQLGKMPFEIEIKSKGISGSSAGLMYALEIIRQMRRPPLTHYKVAGTGTISPNGRVGEILGIEYKILAAKKQKVQIFIMPKLNYKELQPKNYGIKLIPVETLDQAVKELEIVDKL